MSNEHHYPRVYLARALTKLFLSLYYWCRKQSRLRLMSMALTIVVAVATVYFLAL